MHIFQKLSLIAPCGIYCGGCPLYLARSDISLKQKIAEARGISVNKLKLCEGCRALSGRVPSSGEDLCSTYACTVNDQNLMFCYECAKFPCLKLAPCADRASDIPHNTKIYNLLILKRDGVESFSSNYRARVRQYLRGKKPKAGAEIQNSDSA